MHTALEPILKTALTPSTCVDLCLNNNINIAQLTRDLLCFIERGRDSAARRGHIEFLQQLFGLIFVDIHWANSE